MNGAMTGAEPHGLPFDAAAILAPLPGESPAGPSLRYDAVYDAIREARRQDDPSLPQGVWQTTAKRADWDLAIRLCREVLETRSKDLQVACWLAEALVQRHGFAALAPTLRLLAGLCDAFWDGLHPEIDEDGDMAARVAPLEWLNGKLPALLHTLALTRSGGPPVVSHSYADYENAQRRQLAAARDPRGAAAILAKGGATLADIEASAAGTPVAFHHALHARLAEAVAAIDTLSALLDDRCGRQAPGLVGLRTACAGLQGWVDTMLRAKGEEPEMPVPTALSADGNGAATDESFEAFDESFEDGAVPPHYGGGPIQTRDEAYFWLAEAAEFLMRTEPHSPTPYLIQRALGWANMPLHEVLLEVTRGRNDLSAVFDLLGFNFSEMSQQNGGRTGK
ncbi:type VI secretion system protein TssA [Azospirillum agricola]|uniref:type VI secretion system protein TssA n=1 Tax=Azospirillum agricola TaxID=1720247 RepID=UPI000A0F18E3|nr:type VI secretion system protein TssA [Azospirillum agricola]SMH63018.1 type VI secretion system protein ImpA [Azospirillum lipoferum]